MSRRARILPPYTRRVDDLRHRIVQLVGGTTVILLAVLFGFAIALFGLYGWFLYAIPLVLMILLALWMAPDVDTNADRLIARLYFLFLAVLMVWPPYLALNLPGLPWISFQRITMFLLAAVTLYAFATSLRLRLEMGEILASHIWLTRLLLAWIAWQTLMMAVGKFQSASSWVNMLMLRYLFLFVTAWVVIHAGRPQQLVRLILVTITITAAVVIPEARLGKPIWAEHVPSFLSIDPAILESLNTSLFRSNEYRARSIFSNSLVYAEYLGMVLPFCLLAISRAKSAWRRLLLLALLFLLITAGLMTNARTAFITMIATIPAFLGLWIWRRNRLLAGKRDLVAPSLLAMYPAALTMLILATLFVGRVRVRVFGDGSQKYSDAARGDQWAMAIPQIIKNPIGHGMGSIQRVVPYYSPGGKFTIDSYPINLLVEYGIPGFLLFAGLFILAVGMGIRIYLRAEGEDELVAGAAAVGLFSYLLSRLVLSMDGGTNLAFGYAGLILGLWYVQKRREARSGQFRHCGRAAKALALA